MAASTLGQPKEQISLGTVRPSGSFWRQLFVMSKKELTIRFRYPVAFLANIVEVILIIFFFVFSAKAFLPPNGGETSIIVSGTSLFLGFLIYYFLQNGLYAIGNSLRTEQVTGTLESLFLSPASSLANMLSRLVYTIFVSILFTPLVYLVVTLFIGDIRLPLGNLSIWFYFFSTLLVIVGIAFAIAGFALKIKEAMQPLLGFLEFFLIIFSGVFIPFELLGPGRLISMLIPSSYGIDLLRSTVTGTAERTQIASFIAEVTGISTELIVPLQILFVGVSGLMFPLLGLALFNKMLKSAQKNGSLAEF